MRHVLQIVYYLTILIDFFWSKMSPKTQKRSKSDATPAYCSISKLLELIYPTNSRALSHRLSYALRWDGRSENGGTVLYNRLCSFLIVFISQIVVNNQLDFWWSHRTKIVYHTLFITLCYQFGHQSWLLVLKYQPQAQAHKSKSSHPMRLIADSMSPRTASR